MSTTTEQVFNGDGSRYLTRSGATRRANRCELTFAGKDLLVDYYADGAFMAETETDAAEYPTCTVKAVEMVVYGRSATGEWVRCLADVTELLSDRLDKIADAVERQWRGER